MLNRIVAVGLAAGLATAILTSCGGNNKTPTVLGTGALYTFLGDSPVCDVLSFRSTITGMTLKVQGQDNTVAVFPASAAVANLIKVNFSSLRDFATVLNLANVTEGTYDEATLTFSVPQMVVYDPSQSPPIRVVPVTLSNAAPTINIRPALTITKNQVGALRVDLDLLRSVEVNAQGQVTGNVNPVLNAIPVTALEGVGFGELDDLVGFVTTVSPFSASSAFVGSFSLQLLSGTGPLITVNLTSTSELSGVPALNQLETGRVVEVGAFVDENGNIVANNVEVENRTYVPPLGGDPNLNNVGFFGYVLSAEKDANGNVTGFDFFVREEEPDIAGTVLLDSVVKVSVSSTATFQFSSRPTNFASLPFDATAITPGQELIVYGPITVVTNQPTAVAADAIYLKLQTHQGNLSSLVTVASDGKTGAFWLAPCASLLQGTPMLVFTNQDTAFVNVFGLAQLNPQSGLLVRGLPFYESQATTISGVAVPAGTLVLTARQVHQLQ